MPTFHKLLNEFSSGEPNDPEDSKLKYDILSYNVPRGKLVRMRTLVTAYKVLEPRKALTEENLRLAYILGWCVEIVSSALLISDDIIDASTTRRGDTCWYLVKNVGLRAINDAVILDKILYHILNKYFSKHNFYKHLIELFHEVTLKACLGQSLDAMRPTENKTCLTDFYTMSRYNAICKFKTTPYTVVLPVLLATHLANVHDEKLLTQLSNVLEEMGYFFQVENDYVDCYTDPSITGKEGTDIQEGKCTWLIVKALEKATSTQKQELEQNYGKPHHKNIKIIRNLYQELSIPRMFEEYKENIDNILVPYINKISNIYVQNMLLHISEILCKKVYKSK